MNIKQMTKALRKAREAEGFCTLLGIGPMSPALIQATLELSQEQDFPILYIASRNQVDMDEFGAGYVNGWDQKRMVADIKAIADKIGYTGQYYICRDHGGPWQRDEERKAALPTEEAMAIGLKSYLEDVDAGFDLLHIDPTKDPHISGTVPMELVLDRTVTLIEAVEKYIKENNLAPVGYEVGTEETNGGLTGTEEYTSFIEKLCAMLEAKGLPTPDFIVGQTGTLTRLTENIGHYSVENAKKLSDAAAAYNIELKEHNSDYLADDILLLHPALGVGSSNVAPEFGVMETRAYLQLAKLEKMLFEKGLVPEVGAAAETLSRAAIGTGRWRKWMVGEDANLTVEEVLAKPELAALITDISGHYAFEDPAVTKELNAMLDRLEKANVPARRYVLDKIKSRIGEYVTCYNLRGLTSKLRKYAE
ncbi:MAG: class II D-tagatose-bisphosphate aldolase, non-catalytic subunit [Clostridia bacterium]|nr:class II D-tagatose-bisphosphate aldolase, non-catalytic subunit [Clostridia bacterium]